MQLFKPYKHLPGYIHRFSLIVLGRLHIRLHTLLTPDGTPYVHCHPFSYISIILKGGYVEQVINSANRVEELRHGQGSIIFRRGSEYHRIKELVGPSTTLFIAWYHGDWDLKTHSDIDSPLSFKQPDKFGVYKRCVGGKEEHALFDGVWRRGCANPEDASQQIKPSIHQVVERWEAVIAKV